MAIYISIYACIDSSVDGYGRAQHFKKKKMTMLQEKITCLVVHLTHVQENDNLYGCSSQEI